MTHDLHFGKKRIEWALSLVGDEGSRARDPDWYRNDRVITTLEGMMAGVSPSAFLLAAVPFANASVDDVLCSDPSSLVLFRRADAVRNRLAVLWAVVFIWRDKRLRARLSRCTTCRIFYLARKARAAAGPYHCSSRCREHYRDPEPKYFRRTYRARISSVKGFLGDT
jgi:hypothetical protein